MLVQAALNGGTTRAEHPAVPLTPAELAAEARAAADRGAQALHLHPRDAAGAQTLDPGQVLAAVAATRAATGLPVGVTTGIWTVDGDVARRLDLVARWTGPDRPDYASINMNEPGTDDLADLLTSLGIDDRGGRMDGGRRAPARRGRLQGPDTPRADGAGRPQPGGRRRDRRRGRVGARQARRYRAVRCTTVTTWPPGT